MDPSTWVTALVDNNTAALTQLRDTVTHGSQTACLTLLRALITHGGTELAQAPQLPAITRMIVQQIFRAPASEVVPTLEIKDLYRLAAPLPRVQSILLHELANVGTAESCATFADLFAESPPQAESDLGDAISPLLQRDNYDPHWLFPRLLDALHAPAAASLVLDYCNFLIRRQRLQTHPAQTRVASLRLLLHRTSDHLSKLESTPPEDAQDREKISKKINDGVALAIALCTTLGFIDDRESIESLQDVANRRHRRIRLAAALALTRLQDDRGPQLLAELAAEPIVRVAAVTAARDAGFETRIPAAYRSPMALAEGQVANYLAHPIRFAVPPTQLTLRDHRTLHWPGYDQPVACYLFEFTYPLASDVFRNVAVAGPLEATFPIDLCPWQASDIYALAAGWHTEHADMQEWEIDHAPEAARHHTRRHRQVLDRAGIYHDIQVVRLARFWDEWHLIATAVQLPANMPSELAGPTVGTVVVAPGGHATWFPRGEPDRPLEPHLAYACYRGRRLLETFNEATLLS